MLAIILPSRPREEWGVGLVLIIAEVAFFAGGILVLGLAFVLGLREANKKQ
jgi:hypothetical protein